MSAIRFSHYNSTRTHVFSQANRITMSHYFHFFGFTPIFFLILFFCYFYFYRFTVLFVCTSVNTDVHFIVCLSLLYRARCSRRRTRRRRIILFHAKYYLLLDEKGNYRRAPLTSQFSFDPQMHCPHRAPNTDDSALTPSLRLLSFFFFLFFYLIFFIFIFLYNA